jgi:hypothetical protein
VIQAVLVDVGIVKVIELVGRGLCHCGKYIRSLTSQDEGMLLALCSSWCCKAATAAGADEDCKTRRGSERAEVAGERWMRLL